MIKELEILGLRGYSRNQKITFSIPDGNEGSGLSVIVGANNAGKSTAIEAIRALTQKQPPSFTQGRRNKDAGDKVHIKMTNVEGQTLELSSILPASSETEFLKSSDHLDTSGIIVLPSRRTFNPYFGRNEMEKKYYMDNIIGFPAIRTSSIDQFGTRLFTAQKNIETFNEVLGKVLSPVPNWTIDQSDTGQWFLKINTSNSSHSSEGLGEGLVSLFFIIDALYDSEEGDTIVIDEPELSLHPSLQQKLSNLLADYSKNRQIIISTHSPYFINLRALQNNATIIRAYQSNENSYLSQLTSRTANRIGGLLRNYNNPHIFGLKAQEFFFLEDQIILVEGQEDVLFYPKILNQIDIELSGMFFGWGVGGASNMEIIASILHELDYQKVVGILDGDKKDMIAELTTKFPEFHFFAIPSNDVRTKKARDLPDIKGLLDDSNNLIRDEYKEETKNLFQNANKYLKDGAT